MCVCAGLGASAALVKAFKSRERGAVTKCNCLGMLDLRWNWLVVLL